jgi:hypothetical protein
MAYVYRHIRLDTNQPFYIGISKRDDIGYSRAYNRHPKHRSEYWMKVANKTEIEVEILFEGLSYEAAKEKEIEFIALYGRASDGGLLVNLTKGGDGVLGFKNPKLSERNRSGNWKGRKHTEETKLAMSQRNLGKKRSDQDRYKISIGKKGKCNGTKNSNYKGPISVFQHGELIGTYDLIEDVVANVDVSYSHIVKCLLGVGSNYKGYSFKRKSKPCQY